VNRYLLNIGLQESTIIGNGQRIPASDALEVVRRTARMVFGREAANTAHAVHDSDSEPTLIVEIGTSRPERDRVRLLADALCSRLRQEAVAVAQMSAEDRIEWGDLCGPMAGRWGEFNPDYFLMLNGRRAAAPMDHAA